MISKKELPEIKEVLSRLGEPDSEDFKGSGHWTPEKQVDLYGLRLKGFSISQLAEAYGVSYNVVVQNVSIVKRSAGIYKELLKRGLVGGGE